MIKKILSTFLIAFIGSAFALGINKHIEKTKRIQMGVQPETMPIVKTNYNQNGVGYPDFTTAAEMSVHAVVHIKTKFHQNVNVYNPFQDMDPFGFFGGNGFPQQQPQQKIGVGTGSGVIISDDGFIITNNHVVENADQIDITLNNKKNYKAKIIGTDPTTDLALLKIEDTGLPFLHFGNSDSLKVGEWVLAVGNPFNLTSTVTAGIVSAKGRNIGVPGDGGPKIESYIQTDAAINPGNSGGALVNTRGELIGINAAIASNTGSYTGYSFAIPVSIARKVMDDLLKFGTVQRALLGVSLRNIDSDFAEENSISDVEGAYVESIVDKSAASYAGIKKGDIITKINDIKVTNSSELMEQISKFRPGDKISVTFKRDGSENVVFATLKNESGDTGVVKKENTEVISALGAVFEPATKDEKHRLGIESGLKIKSLGNGKLKSQGLRQGFIITFIDKKPINNKQDLIESLKSERGGVLVEGVYPNGTRAYYGIGL